MLTPAHNDPNRDNEIERKKEHPETFTAKAVNNKPGDWKPSGLVDVAGRHLGTDPRIVNKKDDVVSNDELTKRMNSLKAAIRETKDKKEIRSLEQKLIQVEQKLAQSQKEG